MMKQTALVALLVSAVYTSCPAQAQRLQVQQHLSGYTCMALNLTEDQLRDFSALPPVYASPSASSARIGVASATVIVKDPPQIVDGFEAVMHMDGRPGWVKAGVLTPWTNASDPRTRCIPSIMSNGRPGFDYVKPR